VGWGDWLAGGEGWVEPLPRGCGKRVEVLADGVVNCGAGGAEEVCSRQQRTGWGGQGGGTFQCSRRETELWAQWRMVKF